MFRIESIQARSVLLLVASGLAIAGVLFFVEPVQQIFEVFNNKEQLRGAVEEAGVLAPVLFVLLQITQVFIAPIPGQMTGLAAGYFFGVFWGTVLSLLGALIGFALIVLLTRKYGLPFVKHWVGSRALRRFNHLTKKNGALAFFILFLLPVFPDDVLCFVAGLTKIRFSKLLAISALGRLPGYFVLSYIGASGSSGDTLRIVGMLLGVSVLSVFLYYSRGRIEHIIRHLT